MKKYLVLLSFLLLLSSCGLKYDSNQLTGKAFVTGTALEGNTILYLEFDDIPISDAVVRITNQDNSIDLISDDAGMISIDNKILNSNFITFKIEDLNTQGKDFYAQYETNTIVNGSSLEMFTVGSIRGIVVDVLDNVVPNAELKISCDNSIGGEKPTNTDGFGSFYYEYAPVGNCRVYSNFDKGIGFKDVTVKKGELSEVTVKLDKSIINYGSTNIVLVIFIILGAAIVLYLVISSVKKPNTSKTSSSKTNNARQHDVMHTLNHKEKNVVKYLESKNEYISQNEVSREVGIPKTSLIRVIDALDAKNILEIKNIGKFKQIKLSQWFLGKN